MSNLIVINFLYNLIASDIRLTVREHLSQLDIMDRTYFGKDRLKQIKAKIDEIVSILDTKPIEFI